MGLNAFQVVRDFESALCEYTGAPFAVTVNSCTMALLLKLHSLPRHNEPLPWGPGTDSDYPPLDEMEIFR